MSEPASASPSFIYLEGSRLREQEASDGAETSTPAATVLDHHTELHDRLGRPRPVLCGLIEWWAEHSDGAAWADPETMFYPHHVIGSDARPGWEGRFCVDLARSLFTARTYQVTAEMCDIAEAMYEQTAKNAGRLMESDLPADTGFLWLDKPYRRDEGDGNIARFRALSWGTMTVRAGGEAKHAVRLTWWADWLADAVGPAFREAVKEPRMLDELGPLVLSSTMTVPFGSSLIQPGRWSSPLHYAHTLWLLLAAETVTATARPHVERHARRRALRSIQQGDVTVITLRRAAGSDADHDHRAVDWSCRWLVRGFWRHLEGYSAPGHEGRSGGDGLCAVCGSRVTWVRPYVKGPEGRPLKASRQLYRLSR